MKVSLNNPFLTINLRILFVILSFILISCSDEADESKSSQVVSDQPVKKVPLIKQQNKAIEHWLLNENGEINSKLIINRKLDDQERNLLETDRTEMEIGLKDLIQEMDNNLDNPVVRKEIAEKMQQSTVEYKQKMLLLAKDQLKKQNK